MVKAKCTKNEDDKFITLSKNGEKYQTGMQQMWPKSRRQRKKSSIELKLPNYGKIYWQNININAKIGVIRAVSSFSYGANYREEPVKTDPVLPIKDRLILVQPWLLSIANVLTIETGPVLAIKHGPILTIKSDPVLVTKPGQLL
ncbi:hypothetical protein WA026_010174 [Henosepilachna vigintioctopunctata]|uniref:Uncharacterized protein n=1 Tax=Henosepilachna vigintioctopunctata TaxID=420089 RepID=A0AAW1UID9_9CUCU